MKKTARHWGDLIDFRPRYRRSGKSHKYQRKLRARYFRFIQERGLVVPMRYVTEREIREAIESRYGDCHGAPVYDVNSTSSAVAYHIFDPGFYRVRSLNRGMFTTRYAAGYPDYYCRRAAAPQMFKNHERERAAAWDEHWEVTEQIRYMESAKRAKKLFREQTALKKSAPCIGRKFWQAMAVTEAIAG